MKSVGNGGILKGSLQVLHVHILLVAPLGAGHMAQSGADQHEGGVPVREATYHASAAADLPGSFFAFLGVDRLEHLCHQLYLGTRCDREHITVKVYGTPLVPGFGEYEYSGAFPIAGLAMENAPEYSFFSYFSFCEKYYTLSTLSPYLFLLQSCKSCFFIFRETQLHSKKRAQIKAYFLSILPVLLIFYKDVTFTGC